MRFSKCIEIEIGLINLQNCYCGAHLKEVSTNSQFKTTGIEVTFPYFLRLGTLSA